MPQKLTVNKCSQILTGEIKQCPKKTLLETMPLTLDEEYLNTSDFSAPSIPPKPIANLQGTNSQGPEAAKAKGLESIHFKKTVARSSFPSKLWYLLLY